MAYKSELFNMPALKVLINCHNLSRSKIVGRTGISQGQVHRVLEGLIDDGLVTKQMVNHSTTRAMKKDKKARTRFMITDSGRRLLDTLYLVIPEKMKRLKVMRAKEDENEFRRRISKFEKQDTLY